MFKLLEVVYMKPTVIVDIDGVLADLHATVIEQINIKYGLCVKHIDIDNWRKKFGKIDFVKEIFCVFKNRELLLRIPHIQGALEGMSLLDSMDYQIIIASNRPQYTMHNTQEWLILYPYDKLILTADKAEIDGEFLIDDYTKNIQRFAEKDGVGILVNRPWNVWDRACLEKYHDEGLVFYADNWGDIIGILSGWPTKQETKTNDT